MLLFSALGPQARGREEENPKEAEPAVVVVTI